jgi:predicted phosphodiesterase
MKFLHISDLHFDPRNNSEATKDLHLKFGKYVTEKGIMVDEFFFTGDFRNAKEQDDSIDTALSAANFLRTLARYVGVLEDEHIHIVPGNHDLTYPSKDKHENKKELDHVYKNYEHRNGIFHGKMKDDSFCLDYLRKRFGFFEMCAKSLNNSIWNDFQTGKIHRAKHFDNYCIVYLNSAIASGRGSENDRRHLLIGHNALHVILNEIKQKNRQIPVFILSHYTIDAIENSEKSYIKNIFRDFEFPIIWLCGDTHETFCENINNVAFITSGSFVNQQSTEASFFVGELTDNKLILNAYGYDSKNLGWEYKEVLTKRLTEVLPDILKPSVESLTTDSTEKPKYINKDSLEERLKKYAEWVYNTYNKSKFLDLEFQHKDLFVDLQISYSESDTSVTNKKESEPNAIQDGQEKKSNLASQSVKEKEYHKSSYLLETNYPCVLIGEAGTGKSTIVRNLILNSVGQPEVVRYIPVLIELSKLTEKEISEKQTEHYIINELGLEKFGLNIINLCDESRIIPTKKLLLVFDGMDEVSSIEQLEKIIKTIEQFLGAYKNTKLIFTSRPSCEKIKIGSDFYIIGQKVRKFYIEKLSDNLRKEQISRIITATSPKFNKDEFWDDLVNFEKNNPQMIDMTKNPLLLSLILRTYQGNSADDQSRGHFPKNKVELYDKAIDLIIQKRSRIDLLPKELRPIMETLLGRIALTLYEESIKNDSNSIDRILLSNIENDIALELKMSKFIPATLAKDFMEFIRDHSIFTNNKFIHESFKEYFAAKYLFNYLFNIERSKFNVKRTIANEGTFSEIIKTLYSNQNSQAVIEMLLLIVDIETEKDIFPIDILLKTILNDSLKVAPKYRMLFRSVGQFNNHQTCAAAKLIVSMFERTCESEINPFDELFWFMSEYNLKDKKSVGLDNAYEFITKKYAHDLQKLFLAGLCYELFCYLYCESPFSKDKYELFESLFYNLNINNTKIYSQWINAQYSAFIEVDKNGKSPVTWGNLLYFNYYVNIFYGGEFRNTRLIKIHPNNDYFNTDGLVLYSNGKKVLYHHVRKGDYLSEFKVPDTVKHIGNYAFSNCEKLTKIEIPNSVETIGYYAFSNCSGLKEIIIPDTVKKIGEGAFEKCINLENIKLPKSLLELRKKTFLDCRKLDGIQIPDSVVVIGEFAFGKCENLHNIKLPRSLFVIQQQRAFEGCKNVKFDIEENPYFSTDGDIIFNADKTSLIAYPSASGEITISEKINRVDEYAFSGCSELQKVTILNSIGICDTAFSNCIKLSYNNIVYSGQDIQAEKIIPLSLEEAFESKLNEDGLIEIKTGCVYDDKDKTEIILYIKKHKVEDKYILLDYGSTHKYLDNYFEFSEDVKKHIKSISEYFGIRIELVPERNSFFLYLPVIPNKNFETDFLRMLYCIGSLNNMKVFYM